ncbi:MAG TPA: hypothetical protein VGW40_07745 [Allosphingosinicella sp.]|nr:hypothetical protein [Allosphingosinicella sp.]
MIASRPFQAGMRGFGRNALDLPVAGLAGLAVAFVAFAMPGDLLTGLVNATGLPSILSAAEPPLGFKARTGVGLAGGLAAFGLVLALLRLIDRTGLERPQPEAVAEADMPKLRRRDVHPDAPVRRPISAARDLGEPAPPPQPARAPAAPAWLAEADAVVEPAAAVAAPEPVAAPAVPEPAAAEAAVPEPAAAAASLPDLMARLERGLARRTRPPFAPAMPPPAAPQVFPQAGDDRLQSAIDSLQRLAARSD